MGIVALTVAFVGFILRVLGSAPWVVVVGVLSWFGAAIVTLTGFFWARQELPKPRPGYVSMRLMLIHDTVHARAVAQGSGRGAGD